MKKTFSRAIFIIIISASFTYKTYSQEIFKDASLKKIWETAKVFKTPESVCYDPSRNVLYVSNIDGNPLDKDGNGFISKMTMNGDIMELKWLSGLNAPKGMGIYKNFLYVADIDRVAQIDIENMMILRSFIIPDAKFLNDIAIDKKGNVFVSDMLSNRVFKISEGQISLFIDDDLLTNPNGLCVDGDYLYIGCKKIVRSTLKKKNLSIYQDNTGSIDGLDPIGDGRFLFSDWEGRVYILGQDHQKKMILDLTPAKMNAADIFYLSAKKLLFVPTFGDDRVLAFELDE
jgi:hypothetical protein